ncbi:hypothetical protein HPB51_026396 [Rhipicephalus microplus]|uniref:Peptidase M13 N-terminal domain-containing protein n=1 Tax=Rhipicephalus microplus TaxID=6941 RepID=A0A9J6D319_RHIMP|nr:hypothetical protein HPB51_026396 [Rhipicephalus microplus]
MVITAATLLLLVVIGAVLLAYFYGSKMKRKKVATCVTDDCIAFGEELSAAINKAADPCHDFHAYVCGTGDNPVISTPDSKHPLDIIVDLALNWQMNFLFDITNSVVRESATLLILRGRLDAAWEQGMRSPRTPDQYYIY